MKKKTKSYIYTRVSTAIQVDVYSLDAQKHKLRKCAEFQDMEIIGEYSECTDKVYLGEKCIFTEVHCFYGNGLLTA
ncbi:MAG: hypothetical protein ACI4AQ_02440 [Lachnospiraceae bacterium]